MSEYEDEEISFHGKLIGNVIEHWGGQVCLECNDEITRKSLQPLLDKYLPTIQKNVTWDMNPKLIDEGRAVGLVAFLDENGVVKVINFDISNNTKIEEHE